MRECTSIHRGTRRKEIKEERERPLLLTALEGSQHARQGAKLMWAFHSSHDGQ